MTERALVLAPFAQDALAALGRMLPVTYESWTDTRRLYSSEELCARIDVENVSVLITEADFIFEEVFRRSSPLRFLGICRNGLNHVDVKAATDHGVAVVNAPGRNTQGVAELTIVLMLCLARGIHRLNGYVKGGGWESPAEPYVSMGGIELSGKTLGLVGLGSIGRSVSRIARGFGMRVLAYDPWVSTEGRKVAGAQLTSLDDVLRASDFLSVHTSAEPPAEGLLDEGRLGLMKQGSYIVNTASHAVIDETALVKHLESGHIAGAALDVHRTHPIVPTSPLLKLDTVILTPHIGGATDGTVMRQSWLMVEEIGRFLRGQRPRWLVNREVWKRRG